MSRMNIEVTNQTAVVREPGVLITDGPSAMELLATARYETGCAAIVLFKEQLDESFFRLSTGLAGEVLQKFVNYQMKLAIVGGFDRYTSKPLQDFIRESNEGRQICFQPDEASALSWLERALS